MKRALIVSCCLACFLALTITARATVVAQYDFEDGSTPVTSSSDLDLTSTANNFNAGAGISGTVATAVGDNTANPFATSALTGDVNGSPDGVAFTGASADQTTAAGAVANNDYVAFTLTPLAGFTYSFTQLDFKVAFVSAAPAPEGFFVLSTATGASPLTTGTITTTATADGAFQLVSVDLSSVAALQNVTSATQFRIYFYNPDGITSTGGDRLDKVMLQANIAAVPEPVTSVLLVMAVLIVGLVWDQTERRK